MKLPSRPAVAAALLALALNFASPALAQTAAPGALPGVDIVYARTTPGAAKGAKVGDTVTLSNGALEASWSFAGGKLKPVSLTEVASKTRHSLSANDAFRIGVSDVPGLPKASGFVPCNLGADEFTVQGQPKLVRLPANPKAVKLAERSGGYRLTALLAHTPSGVNAEWSAELRDGSHYVRQTIKLTGAKGVLTAVQGLDLAIPGAKQIGSATAGNPVATDTLFAGLELPMGRNELGSGMRAGISCKLPLEKGAVYEISSVIGAYPQGQLRRAFLRYMERERAAPYRQFLHYNGWFDFDRNVTEKGTIDTIAAYDKELMKKRGVPVKAFVIDDGWDNWDTGFWAINKKKFPNDFKAVGKELQRANSRFGIWISPLAGYDHSDQRIALAAKEGLTPGGAKHLDLSYPPYYKWFLDKTSKFIKDDKVAYFKFDKAGSGVNPHFLALLRICRELRQYDPNLVVNITVGTWPSPFWLNHIDCTWREGGDMGWEGFGDDREQWITYRDAQTWRGVVSQGPLYPLNSIMNHGVVLSNGHFFATRAYKAGTDMKNEVRSFFGSGTLMQELYVKPAITPDSAWDQIAEAAKWSAAHADVLVDTHWIGGNPTKGAEVYGWAAWAPRKGVVTLRNPSNEEKTYSLDVAEAFELPEVAAKKYSVKGAYADAPAPFSSAVAGTPQTITLKPLQVLVMEFTPVK